MDWQAWVDVMNASPSLRALIVLLGSVVISLLVALVFHRLAQRLVRGTRTDLDDILVDQLRLPLAASVIILGAWYALYGIPLPEPLPYLANGALFSLGVIWWSLGFSGASTRMLDWLVRNRDRYPTVVTNRTLPIFDIGAKTFIWGGTAYFLLLSWDVNVTGWLASAGIVGVAIGFASQDTLSNLVSGVFILADAPYKLGDWLLLETSERGQVVEIGIRTTRLRTRDDIVIILPNKVMANARIVNQSASNEIGFRVRAPVCVAYGTDLDRVQGLLVEVAQATEGVATHPEPRCRLRSFGPSGLEHELLFWVRDPATRGLVLHQVLSAVYKRFQADGIEIPFPKQDVYLRRAPDAEAPPVTPDTTRS